MSTNQGSAKEYVESYINDYKDEQEYLMKEQPRYDPTKPIPEAPNKKEVEPQQQKQEQSTENPASPPFDLHKKPMSTIFPAETTDKVIQTGQFTSKEQRNELHNTSLTVCADLHEELTTCFQYGSWWDKAKMCEEQKQKFWMCYNAQKRFLKDVGYKGPDKTEKENASILVASYNLRDKMNKKEADK